MSKTVTVPEVARAMGVDLTKSDAWSVGARVREIYKERTGGDTPAYELRKKTSGKGSHCFAVYPATMRRAIEKVISGVKPKKSAQGSLL